MALTVSPFGDLTTGQVPQIMGIRPCAIPHDREPGLDRHATGSGRERGIAGPHHHCYYLHVTPAPFVQRGNSSRQARLADDIDRYVQIVPRLLAIYILCILSCKVPFRKRVAAWIYLRYIYTSSLLIHTSRATITPLSHRP